MVHVPHDWCDGCKCRRPNGRFRVTIHGVVCDVCKPVPRCCQCDKDAVTHLDGDNLCLDHANAWAKSEWIASQEAERDFPLTYENFRG